MACDQDHYHEPAYYGLSHPDPQFPHQYPPQVAFALVGLFLYIEKNFTGKQIQVSTCRSLEAQNDSAPGNAVIFQLPRS